MLLANVCAALAKAHGVHLAQSGERMTFYALFGARDTFESTEWPRFGLVARRVPPPTGAPTPTKRHCCRSTTPFRQLWWLASQSCRSHRGPSAHCQRSLHHRCSTRRLRRQQRQSPSPLHLRTSSPTRPASWSCPLPSSPLPRSSRTSPGFQQALITLDLQVQDNGRVRFFVVVVATDVDGNVLAVPTPQGLMEAARDLIAEDARRGNGRWHRLTARLKNKPTGISVRVKAFA